jgi:release factor glutamine methyltransferase
MSPSAAESPATHAEVTAQLRAAGCVFAEAEADLLIEAAPDPAQLRHLVEQRIAGLPLEHLLGWVEFYGLRLTVTPGVFVPRRRTEFLVEQALRVLDNSPVALPVVLDLCCGSGALGAVIGSRINRIELYASDIDPAASRCAAQNLPHATVYTGDLFAALPVSLRGRIDVLIANAPYVPHEAIDTLPPEARLYEPLAALDGGFDGLAVIGRVLAEAPDWLAPGGAVLVESSRDQAVAVTELARRHQLTPTVRTSPERSATVVLAFAP